MAESDLSLEYWFLAVPNNKDQAKAVRDLQQCIQGRQGQTWHLENVPLTVLRVGTLDNLITLSDNLGRIDAFGKSLVQKLHRTYSELEESEQPLSVHNKTTRAYIQSFVWDEGHLNPRLKLQDLVQNIHTTLQKTAEKLRSGSGKLQDIQSSLSAIERKKTASLMTKNLREYVKTDLWRDGEYIQSVLVVVQTNKLEDFKEVYQFLEESPGNEKLMKMARSKEEAKRQKEEKDSEEKSDMPVEVPAINIYQSHQCRTVVPDSARELARDGDCVLFQLEILRKGYDWFRSVCREQGYVVREFSVDAMDDVDEEKTKMDLEKQAEDQRKKLRIYCRSTFPDTFGRFVHLKIIRVFVESVLRFGLPVDFSVCCVRPPRGNEKKLLKQLEIRYAHLLDDILQKDKSKEQEVDFSGVGGDFYPFIYVPMKIDLA